MLPGATDGSSWQDRKPDFDDGSSMADTIITVQGEYSAWYPAERATVRASGISNRRWWAVPRFAMAPPEESELDTCLDEADRSA